MTELVDNLLQFAVAVLITATVGALALRRRRLEYVLLACFFGTFALGSLYWAAYELLNTYTPRFFYVSDLSWTASYVFLLTLELVLRTPEEIGFRPAAAWCAPALCLALMAFFMRYGDYVTNLLQCGLTAASAWFSLRGLLYARSLGAAGKRRVRLHAVILLYLTGEYALWFTSCFWVSDTLTNPYFWIDFLLSALLPALPHTLKGVVEQ